MSISRITERYNCGLVHRFVVRLAYNISTHVLAMYSLNV